MAALSGFWGQKASRSKQGRVDCCTWRSLAAHLVLASTAEGAVAVGALLRPCPGVVELAVIYDLKTRERGQLAATRAGVSVCQAGCGRRRVLIPDWMGLQGAYLHICSCPAARNGRYFWTFQSEIVRGDLRIIISRQLCGLNVKGILRSSQPFSLAVRRKQGSLCETVGLCTDFNSPRKLAEKKERLQDYPVFTTAPVS